MTSGAWLIVSAVIDLKNHFFRNYMLCETGGLALVFETLFTPR